MIPIVAALLKVGFGVLGNAVLAKGKDVVQDKLGIDIDSALGTEEGRLKLKQAEFEHEEFLVTAAQAADVRELDYFREEVKDKADARQREVEMEKARAAPWWAPSTVTILTFLVVGGCGWMFVTVKDTEARYVLVSIVTMVLTYYYGTTRHSGAKDQVVATALDKAMR